MNVLFANIPFIKYDEKGMIRTGPNAGSRWPWTMPGITTYAPYPFFMGYAVNYLKKNGIDAKFYDGVALKHWNYRLVRESIEKYKPDILFLEVSTPLYWTIQEFAAWAKESFSCRVVFVGPHMRAFAQELIEKPFVDHCVVGEYEIPSLDIVEKADRADLIYEFEHLENIDYVNGENLIPYRPLEYLHNYWDQSMNTQRTQFQVNSSRGCPYKCTYCQWPKVMNNGQYRVRSPELVLEEIKTVIKEHREYLQQVKRDQSLRKKLHMMADNLKSDANMNMNLVRRIRSARHGPEEIKSILFDDDTWNLGRYRIETFCRGLAEIGLPWTMMGRSDACRPELYDLMVDSGCVGMRFGVESFSQRLLDNTKQKLDAKKNFETIKYLITRFSNMEFHFTTMTNLPGETETDRQRDLKLLNELKELGQKSKNNIHWQTSDCIPFPGTELWEELVGLGKADELGNFDLFDGAAENEAKLAEMVGWLGDDYNPSWSEYSGTGDPTDMPHDFDAGSVDCPDGSE